MQAQVKNGDAASNDSLLHLESVARLSKIPIVESAVGVATGLYGKVKESNGVLGWTVNQAEVVSTAALKPAATRLGMVANCLPLHAVDTLLCKGIDIVEENVPAVKLPPQKMLEYVTGGLKDPKGSTAARVIGVGVGAATAGLRTAVSAIEWYMDKYFPEQKNEGKGENDSIQEPEGERKTTKDRDVIIRLQKVSRRLQRNLIRIASAQIKSLKQQREDAASYVGGVAQYIKSAVVHPKEAVSKAEVAWSEMVKRLQEQGDKKPIQRLTCSVVSILDNARQSLHNIPNDVTSRFDAATKYGASVIGSFLNVILKTGNSVTEGSNSDEKAKQLCQRQEKGTSPPPQPLSPAVRPVVVTNDRGSSTAEDQVQRWSSAESLERVIKESPGVVKS